MVTGTARAAAAVRVGCPAQPSPLSALKQFLATVRVPVGVHHEGAAAVQDVTAKLLAVFKQFATLWKRVSQQLEGSPSQERLPERRELPHLANEMVRLALQWVRPTPPAQDALPAAAPGCRAHTPVCLQSYPSHCRAAPGILHSGAACRNACVLQLEAGSSTSNPPPSRGSMAPMPYS